MVCNEFMVVHSLQMDSDDDYYGFEDASDGVSSDDSDDSETEVGKKRKRGGRWDERAGNAAAAVLASGERAKQNPGIQCFVCFEAGKRGNVPDLMGLRQHCGTKLEQAEKHKRFLRILEEEIRAQPTSSSAVMPDVKSHRVLDLQKSMAAVTPFILVLRNIGVMVSTTLLSHIKDTTFSCMHCSLP